MATQSPSLFQPALVREAIGQAFVKLDPRTLLRNPVMFTVELGTAVMLVVTLGLLARPDASQGSFGYNFTVFVVLLLTLLFANFAEAIAEARGKAQADSLRKTRQDTPAKSAAGRWHAGGGELVGGCERAGVRGAKRAILSRPMARSSRAWPRSTSPPLRANRRR